ncbi:MAG: hypothetical protein ACI3XQ_11015 [Eubacteriales bacterium]
MKKSHNKVMSLILSLLILASAFTAVTSVSAEGTELTDNALIKKYGFVCQSADAADGTNPDIAYAKIASDASANSYLELKFGTSGSYPRVFLSDSLVPAALTNYTVSMDIMVVEETTNKLFSVLYAQGSNNKFGSFGFRTGAYTAGKAFGVVYVNDMATPTEELYLGYSDSLKDVESAKKGAVYTLEVTVSATEIGAVPTVKTVFDGVEIANTNTVGLKASKLGISAFKGSTFGFDNIRVKNNDTGEIVFNEDFEAQSTAPVSEGKVFSGWYADSSFKTPAKNGASVGFPKFVGKDVLGLRAQITSGTTAESASTSLRLITTVDGLDYEKVGFRITYNGSSIYRTSGTVYTSILSLGDTYLPTEFSEESAFFATFTLTDIPNSVFGETISVTPVWVTADGTEVAGETADITINALIAAEAK